MIKEIFINLIKIKFYTYLILLPLLMITNLVFAEDNFDKEFNVFKSGAGKYQKKFNTLKEGTSKEAKIIDAAIKELDQALEFVGESYQRDDIESTKITLDFIQKSISDIEKLIPQEITSDMSEMDMTAMSPEDLKKMKEITDGMKINKKQKLTSLVEDMETLNQKGLNTFSITYKLNNLGVQTLSFEEIVRALNDNPSLKKQILKSINNGLKSAGISEREILAVEDKIKLASFTPPKAGKIIEEKPIVIEKSDVEKRREARRKAIEARAKAKKAAEDAQNASNEAQQTSEAAANALKIAKAAADKAAMSAAKATTEKANEALRKAESDVAEAELEVAKQYAKQTAETARIAATKAEEATNEAQRLKDIIDELNKPINCPNDERGCRGGVRDAEWQLKQAKENAKRAKDDKIFKDADEIEKEKLAGIKEELAKQKAEAKDAEFEIEVASDDRISKEATARTLSQYEWDNDTDSWVGARKDQELRVKNLVYNEAINFNFTEEQAEKLSINASTRFQDMHFDATEVWQEVIARGGTEAEADFAAEKLLFEDNVYGKWGQNFWGSVECPDCDESMDFPDPTLGSIKQWLTTVGKADFKIINADNDEYRFNRLSKEATAISMLIGYDYGDPDGGWSQNGAIWKGRYAELGKKVEEDVRAAAEKYGLTNDQTDVLSSNVFTRFKDIWFHGTEVLTMAKLEGATDAEADLAVEEWIKNNPDYEKWLTLIDLFDPDITQDPVKIEEWFKNKPSNFFEKVTASDLRITKEATERAIKGYEEVVTESNGVRLAVKKAALKSNLFSKEEAEILSLNAQTRYKDMWFHGTELSAAMRSRGKSWKAADEATIKLFQANEEWMEWMAKLWIVDDSTEIDDEYLPDPEQLAIWFEKLSELEKAAVDAAAEAKEAAEEYSSAIKEAEVASLYLEDAIKKIEVARTFYEKALESADAAKKKYAKLTSDYRIAQKKADQSAEEAKQAKEAAELAAKNASPEKAEEAATKARQAAEKARIAAEVAQQAAADAQNALLNKNTTQAAADAAKEAMDAANKAYADAKQASEEATKIAAALGVTLKPVRQMKMGTITKNPKLAKAMNRMSDSAVYKLIESGALPSDMVQDYIDNGKNAPILPCGTSTCEMVPGVVYPEDDYEAIRQMDMGTIAKNTKLAKAMNGMSDADVYFLLESGALSTDLVRDYIDNGNNAPILPCGSSTCEMIPGVSYNWSGYDEDGNWVGTISVGFDNEKAAGMFAQRIENLSKGCSGGNEGNCVELKRYNVNSVDLIEKVKLPNETTLIERLKSGCVGGDQSSCNIIDDMSEGIRINKDGNWITEPVLNIELYVEALKKSCDDGDSNSCAEWEEKKITFQPICLAIGCERLPGDPNWKDPGEIGRIPGDKLLPYPIEGRKVTVTKIWGNKRIDPAFYDSEEAKNYSYSYIEGGVDTMQMVASKYGFGRGSGSKRGGMFRSMDRAYKKWLDRTGREDLGIGDEYYANLLEDPDIILPGVDPGIYPIIEPPIKCHAEIPQCRVVPWPPWLPYPFPPGFPMPPRPGDDLVIYPGGKLPEGYKTGWAGEPDIEGMRLINMQEATKPKRLMGIGTISSNPRLAAAMNGMTDAAVYKLLESGVLPADVVQDYIDNGGNPPILPCGSSTCEMIEGVDYGEYGEAVRQMDMGTVTDNPALATAMNGMSDRDVFKLLESGILSTDMVQEYIADGENAPVLPCGSSTCEMIPGTIYNGELYDPNLEFAKPIYDIAIDVEDIATETAEAASSAAAEAAPEAAAAAQEIADVVLNEGAVIRGASGEVISQSEAYDQMPEGGKINPDGTLEPCHAGNVGAEGC